MSHIAHLNDYGNSINAVSTCSLTISLQATVSSSEWLYGGLEVRLPLYLTNVQLLGKAHAEFGELPRV